MTDLLKKLSEPFPPSAVSWRVGATTQAKDKGMALAYIDSRDVQDRLNAVCGHEWQCRFPHAAQKTVCEIGLKIDGEWYWRANGAGDTDVEQEKGALSDAFKRAAVMWGIGRYLYDIDSPWVPIEQKGKSSVITADGLKTLRAILAGQPAPQATVAPKVEITEPYRIKAESGADWAAKFRAAVNAQKSVEALNGLCDFNDGWLKKLPPALYADCEAEITKRMHFLGQAPLNQDAE